MKNYPALISIVISLLSVSFSQDFFKNELRDVNDKAFSFDALRNNKATAVIFLSDCPASQSYTLKLNSFAKKYSDKGIGFIGIFPGKYSTDAELKTFKSTYKISFPLLKDPDMKIARQLHATIAPGCFLINKSSSIAYEGRIDDWYSSLGKTKQSVTQENLRDAINCVLSGKAVGVPKTTAVGCILEYEN